jgi:hypothetical protein
MFKYQAQSFSYFSYEFLKQNNIMKKVLILKYQQYIDSYKVFNLEIFNAKMRGRLTLSPTINHKEVAPLFSLFLIQNLANMLLS